MTETLWYQVYEYEYENEFKKWEISALETSLIKKLKKSRSVSLFLFFSIVCSRQWWQIFEIYIFSWNLLDSWTWRFTFSFHSRWFRGTWSRPRAEVELKAENKEGCFILRNSSTPGRYTTSILTKNNRFGHFYYSTQGWGGHLQVFLCQRRGRRGGGMGWLSVVLHLISSLTWLVSFKFWNSYFLDWSVCVLFHLWWLMPKRGYEYDQQNSFCRRYQTLKWKYFLQDHTYISFLYSSWEFNKAYFSSSKVESKNNELSNGAWQSRTERNQTKKKSVKCYGGSKRYYLYAFVCFKNSQSDDFEVKHYHIKLNAAGEFFISQAHTFKDVPSLVEYHSLNAGGNLLEILLPRGWFLSGMASQNVRCKKVGCTSASMYRNLSYAGTV